jgi:anaerobic selenocysteine-containing dehydrogenase
LFKGIQQEEDWLINMGKAMGLPGLGKDALGPGIDINNAEDWYVKTFANIAMEGEGVLPGASEAEQIKYVLARGGRFEDAGEAYDGDHLAHKRKSRLNLYIEKLGSTKDSMTSKYFDGIAKYVPVEDARGNSIDDEGFPLHLITYKTAIHTQSRTINNPSLTRIWPENWVELNQIDADALGIITGDKVVVSSKTNEKGEIGTAKVREGVRPGVVAISHNYGHWQSGSATFDVDGRLTSRTKDRSKGINSNPIMRVDTSLGGVVLGDKGGGSSSFFDTKVKVRKV